VKYISFLLLFSLLSACDSSTTHQQQEYATTADTAKTATTTTTSPPADTSTAKMSAQAPDSTQVLGQKIYSQYCLVCHQSSGSGVPNMYPPLAKSDWVQGEKTRLIQVLLNGLSGQIKVNNETYNQVMPSHSFLKDEEIAAVLSYVRQNFGNQAEAITPEEVKALRGKS
jgi:mono/diheme cytochrome c family protein